MTNPILRQVAYLAFVTSLVVATVVPPDFGRVTLAGFHDIEGAVDNAFSANFGPDLARLCSVFWASRGSGTDTLIVSGNSHLFDACLFSNSTLTITTSGTTFNQALRHAGTYTNTTNPNVFNAGVIPVSPRPYPTPFTFSDYAADPTGTPTGCKAVAAAALGEFHYRSGNNVRIRQADMRDGLWYINGNAIVEPGASTDAATFVATGTLRFDVGAGGARPYVDGLLGYANGAAENTIRVAGGATAGETSGALYAPNGEMTWQGTGNTYVGQVSASVVKLGGHSSTFRAGPALEHEPCPVAPASFAGPDTTAARTNATFVGDNTTAVLGALLDAGPVDVLDRLPAVLP